MVPKRRICGAVVCTLTLIQAPVVYAKTMDLEGFGNLFGEPVTTSVTGLPMRASQVPINMTIITAEDIQRSGSLNIPQILARLAGLDVLQWTDSHYDVSIRGYNQAYSPRLLVMINGRQVYLDHYGLTAWSALPVQLSEIYQIEVVRGPNTALFGFNAVSGVVNIITYNPLYHQVNEINTSIGTHSTRDYNATGTVGKLNEYGIRISTGFADIGNYDEEPSQAESLFETDAERIALSIDGGVSLGPHTELSFDFSHVDAEYNEIEPAYSYADANYNISSIKGRLIHDTEYGLWTLSAYQNKMRETLNSQALSIIAGSQLRGRTTLQIASVENDFSPFPNHHIHTVAEYRDNSGELSFAGGSDISYHVTSVGGSWSWQILDSLSTVVSGRFDRLDLQMDGDVPFPRQTEDFDQKHHEYSYNLAAIYRPTAEDAFRLSSARGIQTPSLLELAIGFPPQPGLGNILLLGNPGLSPTTIQTYELDYERELPELASKLKLAAYYQEFKELKSLPALGAGGVELINGVPVTQSQNIGDSSAWGMEAELAGTIADMFRYGLNYSYINIDDDLSVGDNALTYHAIYEDGTPDHRVKAQLGADWERWQADLFLHWQSKRDLIDNPSGLGLIRSEIDGSFNMDARIGFQLNDNFSFALAGTNLLGDKKTTTGLDIDRRFVLSAKIKLN